jgi:hypothetical protein
MKFTLPTLGLLILVLLGGFFLWPTTEPILPSDELSGSWRAQAAPDAEYQWWMEYEFQQGMYSLKTDSMYTEQGTYEILERFLDGSILVRKTYADGTKVYEIVLLTDPEDPNILSLEGVQLHRQ